MSVAIPVDHASPPEGHSVSRVILAYGNVSLGEGWEIFVSYVRVCSQCRSVRCTCNVMSGWGGWVNIPNSRGLLHLC